MTVSQRIMSACGSRDGRRDTTTTSLEFPVMIMSSPAAWQSSTPVDSAGYWDTTTRYNIHVHTLYIYIWEEWSLGM